MKAPNTELREIIRTRLIDDPGVTLTDVHSNVPDDITFPYARFGSASNDSDDEETRDVDDISLEFHIFSRAGGYAELENLVSEVKKSLHDWEGYMVDNALRMIRVPSTQMIPDPDNLTVHAVMRIESTVEVL